MASQRTCKSPHSLTTVSKHPFRKLTHLPMRSWGSKASLDLAPPILQGRRILLWLPASDVHRPAVMVCLKHVGVLRRKKGVHWRSRRSSLCRLCKHVVDERSWNLVVSHLQALRKLERNRHVPCEPARHFCQAGTPCCLQKDPLRTVF